MAVLPKRNLVPTSAARKKAIPKVMESPVQSVIESSEPVLPKLIQGLKPWQSSPNTSTELISCCSSHKECIAYGDCAEKAFHVNYGKVCSLYKRIRNERR